MCFLWNSCKNTISAYENTILTKNLENTKSVWEGSSNCQRYFENALYRRIRPNFFWLLYLLKRPALEYEKNEEGIPDLEEGFPAFPNWKYTSVKYIEA